MNARERQGAPGRAIKIPLFCRRKRTFEPKNLSDYPYFAPPNAPRSQKCFILTQRNDPPTDEAVNIPLFCRTTRTSEPKMPYFYLKREPPHTEATFLSVEPEPTGNPSKNPQKHYKKPLPPCEAAGRRRAAGWDGWAGLAG